MELKISMVINGAMNSHGVSNKRLSLLDVYNTIDRYI